MAGINVWAGPSTIEAPKLDDLALESSDHGWVVTVYDNEFNTWDEVMFILMAGTHCTEQEAYLETWEVDHLGKSVVHHGQQQDCLDAASIIATIGIRVEVTQE